MAVSQGWSDVDGGWFDWKGKILRSIAIACRNRDLPYRKAFTTLNEPAVTRYHNTDTPSIYRSCPFSRRRRSRHTSRSDFPIQTKAKQLFKEEFRPERYQT